MTNFKYTLRTGSKKDVCPACGKKTFVPFIETETGNELPAFGRCDREQHCNYFRKPESNEPIVMQKFEPIEKPTDYLSLELLNEYFSLTNTSNFYKWLLSKFPKSAVIKAEYDYYLSCKGTAVIFWQIDNQERVRSGKLMEYNPTTGKRIKDLNGKSQINWMHKQPFNLKQCPFGLHLAKENPSSIIGIVESEKTAVIASIKYPDIIWMACGSVSGFKLEMLAPLKLRKIIGFPDKGCFKKWNEVAEQLNEKGFSITIDDTLEKNTNANLGDDIADWIEL